MTIPSIYDDIRPFEPNELPAVYKRLLANEQFRQVLAYLYPGVPTEAIGKKMTECKTCLDFQLAFCYKFLEELMAKASKGLDMDVKDVDVTKRYTFVSNHRDIVLDSALLDKLLYDAGFKTTCEIAIGD
ncbi:MAG TPA: acyltransferase, partial [Prevotella sp.]|nr:acyltransferase [Prevotella sp.]